MSIPIEQVDFSQLSPKERILLAERLWDSVMEKDVPPLTAAQLAEIDSRLDALEAGTMPVYSWEEVKERLLSKNK